MNKNDEPNDKLKWYDEEYNRIRELINNKNTLSHYHVLRIMNFKTNVKLWEPEENIPVKTNEAFKLAEENNIKDAIGKLMNIKGVGVAIASAILALRFPDKYAIIDKTVVETLEKQKNARQSSQRNGWRI